MVRCSFCNSLQLSMNIERHEERCRRLSQVPSSAMTSTELSAADTEIFDFGFTTEPDHDPTSVAQDINDLELLMSPTMSLRAKYLLILRHFFGVPSDIPRTQPNQQTNKYLQMYRILRTLPKVSSASAVSNIPQIQNNQVNPDVLRMLSELCPTQGKLKVFASILERAGISAPSLKLSMLQLSKRTTTQHFTCVKVWEDRFFYFRRLDDVLRNEVFGDPRVDSRLTWGHPGERMRRFESFLQLTYRGCTPVGLVFWSDSASPSNWSSVSFHPIFVRLTNDPADKYTLVGLIPAAPQSAKKSFVASFKTAMIHRCWKLLLSTAPLKREQRSMPLLRASTGKWISVRPWIFAFLGDLPELDGFSGLIQNQTSCRTCYAAGLEMNPLSTQPSAPRNIAAESLLCREIRSIAKSDGSLGHLTTNNELIQQLRAVNKHPIPSILNDSRFLGYPIPTIDDLYHNFDGGLLDNIRELIFDVVQSSSRDSRSVSVFDGDWMNFVSICLRIMSQKRFQYPGQHLMSQGFERAKKYGNFNARFTLAQVMPFMIHAIVDDRSNPGLLLMVSYVSFRNLVQNARSDCPTMETSYEEVRKIFLFLYCKFISPKLSTPFHPKFHRVGRHMSWKDVLEFGSFARFGCKTGEACLKPLKKTWNSIGGSNADEFARAITRRIDMQVNASVDRPLHLTPSDEANKPVKNFKSDLSIFRKTAGTAGIRLEHQSYIQQLCDADLPTKHGEKIRLNIGTCQTKKPIHRDSFIEYLDENGETTGGILLEILYQRTFRRWICLVMQYQPHGIDQLLFNLPLWVKTTRVILLLPSQILKQIPMIPDFGSCFRANAMGLHPSPIWLRTHCLLTSSALSSLVQIASDDQPQENTPLVNPIPPPEGAVDDVTEMLSKMSLDDHYVRDTAPHQVSETIAQLQSLSDSSPPQSIGASALTIQIRVQLLDLIRAPPPTHPESSTRPKRARRPPIWLNDYERS